MGWGVVFLPLLGIKFIDTIKPDNYIILLGIFEVTLNTIMQVLLWLMCQFLIVPYGVLVPGSLDVLLFFFLIGSCIFINDIYQVLIIGCIHYFIMFFCTTSPLLESTTLVGFMILVVSLWSTEIFTFKSSLASSISLFLDTLVLLSLYLVYWCFCLVTFHF